MGIQAVLDYLFQIEEVFGYTNKELVTDDISFRGKDMTRILLPTRFYYRPEGPNSLNE